MGSIKIHGQQVLFLMYLFKQNLNVSSETIGQSWK